MNKQEAIEEVTELFGDSIEAKTFRNIIRKLHEPQKVTVPKFIADWIEYCKRCNLDLQMTLSRLDDDREVGDWAYDENDDLVSEKVDMIARAWLSGYEIEQEKLYTIEIPNPNINAHAVLQKIGKGLALIMVTNARWKGWESSKLTESEIKQDFDFLWQLAKEVE
ncbi:TPA: DUF1642 domain-containing protein [Streptococcus suis]|nr:DUF1642 domain-containing protein [Streptococcus suis]